MHQLQRNRLHQPAIVIARAAIVVAVGIGMCNPSLNQPAVVPVLLHQPLQLLNRLGMCNRLDQPVIVLAGSGASFEIQMLHGIINGLK